MANSMWEGGQEVQANWFKFEKVGDGIKGTLLGKKLQPANLPGYQDQWVYELKDENGQIWNVGIGAGKEGTIQRLARCKVGELIGILFEKEGEPKKGFKPAKFLKVFSWGMDPNYNQMEGGEEINPMDNIEM